MAQDDQDIQWGNSAPQNDVQFGNSAVVPPAAPNSINPDDDIQFGNASVENQKPENLQTSDYDSMPYSEIGRRFATNLIPSAGRALASIPSMIANAPQIGSALGEVRQMPNATAQPMGNAPLTPASLAKQWVSPEESGVGQPMTDEEEKAHQAAREATYQGIVKPFTSVPGFWQAVAEDPFTVLTALSAPLSGGASMLGDTGLAARTLQGLSYATDPTKAAIGLTGAAANLAKGVGKATVAGAAGVPTYSLDKAAEAGATVNPEIKNAFNTFANGEGNPVDFQQSIKNAIGNIINKAISAWAKSKEAMTGAATQDIPTQQISDAIDAARNTLDPRNIAYPSHLEAHDALDQIENLLNGRNGYPSGSPQRTLAGFDNLKRQLYDFANMQSSTDARNAVLGVHAATKDAINSVAPEYQNLMGNYQEILGDLNNINKTTGSPKAAANSAIAKMIRNQKTPQGQSIMEQLAQEDPRIPYMVAGATLHDAAPGGMTGVLEKAGVGLNAGLAIQALNEGDIPRSVFHMGLMGLQPIVQSPKLVGKIAYGLGWTGNTLPAHAISAAASAAKNTEPFVAPVAANLYHSQQSSGGRIGRKTGGKVTKGHQHLVDRLFKMAEQAKRKSKETTKPLLHVDDNTIAKALSIANKNI